jgi:diacylglycerol kinase (ATP)
MIATTDIPLGNMASEAKLRGFSRLKPAFQNTLAGLQAAWAEPAFYMEAWAALFMLPWAFVLGQTWLEIAVLMGSVVLVLIVEILNTGIESAIDRVGPEWHEMSKRAKDLGSAAVFLSLLLCAGVWVAAGVNAWPRLWTA